MRLFRACLNALTQPKPLGILPVMRVMALDFGSKSTGVALSDELQLVAHPLTTLRRHQLKFVELLERIASLVAEYEVGILVVGLPLNMDGTRGSATHRVESFVAELKRYVRIPIVLLDERLTSFEAEQLLRRMGVGERERRTRSDEYAALLILRDYSLEHKRNREASLSI
jgi:putative holliday junction resolvase